MLNSIVFLMATSLVSAGLTEDATHAYPLPAALAELDAGSHHARALTQPYVVETHSGLSARALAAVRQGAEDEPVCDPLSAVTDVLMAVPVFLSANGGFEAALAKAVASLDGCTIKYFGAIILGAGESPLGSLCR